MRDFKEGIASKKKKKKEGTASEDQIPLRRNSDKDEFPVGLRVLAVDDNPVCLRILEKLLQRCRYKVTVTTQAESALKLLSENNGTFDIVLSDVCMPDMDGFQLLEIIGLKMEIPVIMMSANGETSTVMKGIKNRAVDYLLKPIRLEELKNIWQHVIRKTLLKPKEGNDDSCSLNCETKQASDRRLTATKRCIDQNKEKEDESNDLLDENSSAQKRPRMVWSTDLHTRFISAINQLGIKNVTPIKILEIMNCPELTRVNVASHLQKYRHTLKKNSDMISQQCNNGATTSSRIGFGVNRCNNHSGMMQFGHAQKPSTVHLNLQSLPLPLNQQDIFRWYPKTLEVDRPTERMSSHNPDYRASREPWPRYVPLLEYPSNEKPLRVSLDAAEPSCLKLRDGSFIEQSATAPLDPFTGHYEEQNLVPCNASVGSDLNGQMDGSSLDMQSCSAQFFTGSGQMKLVEKEHLEAEGFFNFSSGRSAGDLNAALMQFRRQ